MIWEDPKHGGIPVGARKDFALESIRSKFADWRRTKRSGEAIPAVLWDEVYALEARVGRSRLALDLGLNTSELAFQMNLRGGAKVQDCEKVQVQAQVSKAPLLPRVATSAVAITKVVSVPLPESRPRAAVEIEAPSGWLLRLQAEASPEFLRVFVEALGRIGGGT